jgi:hypothetical protein
MPKWKSSNHKKRDEFHPPNLDPDEVAAGEFQTGESAELRPAQDAENPRRLP